MPFFPAFVILIVLHVLHGLHVKHATSLWFRQYILKYCDAVFAVTCESHDVIMIRGYMQMVYCFSILSNQP